MFNTCFVHVGRSLEFVIPFEAKTHFLCRRGGTHDETDIKKKSTQKRKRPET